MKLIFNLTIILLSTSCLLAATNTIDYGTESRQQPIGNRMQVRDTNQAAGYRVQETGSNQTTEAVSTNNKIVLLLENQIGQRAEATKNYELRTKNCNNQSINFDCYLMMNPETTQELEDVLRISKKLRFSSETCSEVSSEREILNAAQVSSIEGESSMCAVIPSQSDVIENNSKNNKNSDIVDNKNIEIYFTNIKEKILEPVLKVAEADEGEGVEGAQKLSVQELLDASSTGATKSFAGEGDFEDRFSVLTSQIEAAKQASKEQRGGENSYLWDRIVIKLEQARDSWNKFSELLSQGRQERAFLWKKAAEESEAASKGIRQVVQAYIADQNKAAQQLEKETWGAYYLSDAFTWSLKSEEALEKANQVSSKDRDFWRGLGEQYQIAVDYEKKASEAHNLGKENERKNCAWIGRYLHSSACRKLKAMEAREAGKEELAVGYQDASEVFQQAVEQSKQAIVAYTLGKESEGHSWSWAGDSLQKKADYLVKASEAKEIGKIILAFGYREAAIISELAADQWKLSAETEVAGKTSEGNSWSWVGDSLQKKADYQAKASEAEEAGKTTLAAGYRKAAITSELASDQWKLSAETRAVGKESEEDSLGDAGKVLQDMADYEAKASEAEEAEKLILATGYREAAETLQRAAGIRHQAGEAIASGKEDVGACLGWVGRSLQLKANYQVKVIELREEGKKILAAIYIEAAETSQKASEYCQQAADIYVLGKEDESYNCYLVGEYLQLKAEHQAEVAEQKKEEPKKSVIGKINTMTPNISGANGNLNPTLISSKQRIDSLMKKKALFVYCEKWLAEGGSIVGISDYVVHVLHTLQRSADHQLIRSYEEYRNNVWEAHKLGDDFLAFSLIQVVEDIQQAIEDSIQQAKASENYNSKLSDAWKNVVQAGQKLAECRDRYIQISVGLQPPEIVSGWKKIVEGLQSTVEYLRKAAEACALQNEQEYKRFNSAADSMKESVKKLEKAVIALEKSFNSTQPETSTLWRKTAEEYKISAEFDVKAAEEKANTTDSDCFRTTECFGRYITI